MEKGSNIKVSGWLKIVYFISLTISMLVGLWHFFVRIYLTGMTTCPCNIKI